jgi:serine/threonine protein kinase
MGGAQIDELPAEVSFGGYTLLKRLAVGGMAEIFLARDRDGSPDEFIVVKRLLKHIASHNGLVQMFLDEARVAATLDHPNIVKVFNVGSIADQYFLSMEHLNGLDLARISRGVRRSKRPLPLSVALYTCARVASALEYAHSKIGHDGKPLAIVHRDLSPHNVFVTFDGDVKLLDFGVAKAANALHRTKTGALIGKVAYMSPEHCQTGAIDRRSDLFSLGIILWELTLGRRLYSTKKLGEFEVLRRICDEPVVPPSALLKDFPPAVEAIIHKALEKDKERRFQNAGELEKAILKAAADLDYDLSPEAMVRFLREEMGDVVERITDSIKKLEVPSRAAAISQSTPSMPGTPSGMSYPSPSQPGGLSFSGEELEDDEERTERILRRATTTTGSQPRNVTWKQVATIPPPTSGLSRAPRSQSPWLAIAVVALLAMVALALVAWLLLR